MHVVLLCDSRSGLDSAVRYLGPDGLVKGHPVVQAVWVVQSPQVRPHVRPGLGANDPPMTPPSPFGMDVVVVLELIIPPMTPIVGR